MINYEKNNNSNNRMW